MPGLTDLSISDIAAQVLDPSAYEEAVRPRTIPTGSYRLRHREHKGQVNDAGQQSVHLTVEALSTENERRGTLFFDVTPNIYRREDGRLHKMTALFGQLSKAVNRVGEDVEKVLSAFEETLIQGYVTETLRGPEGIGGYEKVAYTDDGGYSEKTLALLDEGWVPKNYVQSISKVKEGA